MIRTRIFIVVSCAAFAAATLPARAAERPFLVVLDPGHGGHDEGTTWGKGRSKISEKVIVLKIARAVARQLRAQRIRTILTRKEDRYVELEDRTALANRLGADAFVSIHINSNPKHRRGHASGAETYILNHTSDATSRRLAKLENRVLNGSKARRDLHQDQAVSLILKDLILDSNLKESHRLACSIQTKVVGAQPSRKKRRQLVLENRGVKQALFYVLLGADMPSALFEAGFIDHPSDRRLLTSARGVKTVAHRLSQAILGFRKPRQQQMATLSTCQIR